jgi:hypothetical protein
MVPARVFGEFRPICSFWLAVMGPLAVSRNAGASAGELVPGGFGVLTLPFMRLELLVV